MKRAIILILCTAAMGLLISCGNYNNPSSSTTPTSGIKKRAFVTNNFQSQIDIVNAANDTVNTTVTTDLSGASTQTLANTVSTGTTPAQMALTPDKTLTLVFGQSANTISVISNATESLSGQIPLADFTESFLAAPDNTTAYVAVPNAVITGQTSGAVEVLNVVNGTLTDSIPVPRARRVVLSPDGKKLLVFADGTDQMWVIDTSTKTATTVTGFDRPVFGVFSTDNSKAFILNCGPECGGTAAKVTVLDMATNTTGASIPVSAATIGLLDGSNLYVAGTGAGGGKLDVINTSSLTVTKSGVAISDGYHQRIALGSNGKLFIGSRTCNNSAQGCLSIVDTGAGTAVLSPAGGGDVTGIEPISGRSVVYVIEGGELRIYSTTTSQQQATQIDIVGKAVDVKLVD
ncbi:MAG: YncE family protein [Acidobacteriia bacterium]|nr:YncE family protein [Terriglobia bacterium]